MVLPSPEEEDKMETTVTLARQGPWNKGKLVGQKAPLKVKDIWAIRVRLRYRRALGILLCSISGLIASFAAAIS